jgi:prepilin peptidase CpaA
MLFPILAQSILVVTVATLFYVAVTDLKEYSIKNELIIVLAGLFFIHAAVSGRWVELHWNIGFAGFMIALMLVAYAQNLMAGGDLKILAVAFLWVGVHCALPFAILLFVFGILHTIAAKLGWVGAQKVEGRIRIAVAPAVACALIGSFMVGCLQPKQSVMHGSLLLPDRAPSRQVSDREAHVRLSDAECLSNARESRPSRARRRHQGALVQHERLARSEQTVALTRFEGRGWRNSMAPS